jgi:hypothetical protein
LSWKKHFESAMTLEISAEDQRETFRVRPAGSDPVTVSLPECDISVVEISAGGLSFVRVGMKKETKAVIQMSLPEVPGNVDVKIEVMRVSDDGHVHCRFVDLDEEQEDKIHYYVLCRQKKMITDQRQKISR